MGALSQVDIPLGTIKRETNKIKKDHYPPEVTNNSFKKCNGSSIVKKMPCTKSIRFGNGWSEPNEMIYGLCLVYDS